MRFRKERIEKLTNVAYSDRDALKLDVALVLETVLPQVAFSSKSMGSLHLDAVRSVGSLIWAKVVVEYLSTQKVNDEERRELKQSVGEVARDLIVDLITNDSELIDSALARMLRAQF